MEEKALRKGQKKGKQLLEKPWIQNIDWSSTFEEEIKDKVATYKPLSGTDIQQARILMIGQVGAGKSSYFNTINSIFRGHISIQANAGSAEHSLTTSYRMYQVRDGYAGKPLNFRLCDTRGLEEDQGLEDQEIGYLLDGHVPEKYKFNPALPLSPDSPGFLENPTLSDKIHCVAFVLDASSVDVLPQKVMERFKALQAKMNQRGIPQVVLLTSIDKICEEISDDVCKVFFSGAVNECVARVAMMMRLPQSQVFPVKNYHSEVELDPNINILSLFSLSRILNFVDDFLYNKLDEIDAETMRNTKTMLTSAGSVYYMQGWSGGAVNTIDFNHDGRGSMIPQSIMKSFFEIVEPMYPNPGEQIHLDDDFFPVTTVGHVVVYSLVKERFNID